MKRFLIVLLLLLMMPYSAFAIDDVTADEYNNQLSTYDFSFFNDTLNEDTIAFLKDLGIDDFNFENISALSLNDIFDVIKNLIKGKFETPLKGAFAVLVYILLSSLFQSFKGGEGSSMADTYSSAVSIIIAVILVVKAGSTISLASVSISIAGNFIYAFIPVFCTIVAAGGGITTSFSTNTMLLILSQGLSFISSNVFMPVVNCFLALGICTGIRTEIKLDKLIDTLKKIIITVISFCAGAFVSILTIKTSVAARADVLGIRSVRFVISSVVPVIGGAISEGLLSIQSYSSLIKSSVGIVGIIAVALVFLPSIIEVALWRFMLSLCSVVADVFDDKNVSYVLKAFKDSMLLINVILVLSMMTTVISIGILVAARTA